MSALADYCFFNSGNECPQVYHIWSYLATYSAILSRKVWISRNYFSIFPNLYVCLVGDAGSGKNTSKNIATKKLLMDQFPDVPVSASVTSREDICKFMGSEECLRSFRKEDGSIQEFRPFHFAVNELANLLSVDFRKMVDFLVDVYDSEYFSTSFKRDSVKDKIPYPCATMLACAVPDWFMRALRADLFTGGFGRRLTIVYENKTILNANPSIPPGGEEAWQRVVAHMQAARDLCGEVRLSDAATKWWNAWYEDPKRLHSEDPILRQMYAGKHIMVQKVAMLLALDELPFRMVIKPEHFVQALALLEVLEPPLRKLSSGIGRNELAAISVQLLDMLANMGGHATEKKLRAMFFRDCRVQSNEFNAMLNHLSETDQIHVTQGDVNGHVIMLPEVHERWLKEKKL